MINLPGMKLSGEKAFLAEQARFIHKQAPTSQLGGLLISSILLYIMSEKLPLPQVLGWFIALHLVSLWRFLGWYKMKHRLQDDSAMVSWLGHMIPIFFLAGLVWGIGGYMFYLPGFDNYNFIVCLMFLSLISGSVVPLAPYISCYYVYSLPLTIPLTIKMTIVSSGNYLLIPFGMACYLLFHISYARSLQLSTKRLIQLNHENEKLAELMAIKHGQAEKHASVAADANKTKSEFLAATSHDLAQPLHSLSLFLSAIKMEEDAEKLQEHIHKAYQCVDHMKDHFNALMDISRIDSGAYQPDIKTYDIADLVLPIIEEFSLDKQYSDHIFDHDVFSCLVSTDGILLQRILRNLISNAAKHNSSCTIGINTNIIGDKLQIIVYDTGKGIPEQEWQNIFKEYYQLENPERDRNKGSGLGLAIVQKLCHIIGSPISINSKPGEGCQFTLAISLAKDFHSPVTKPRHDDDMTGISDAQILFIDDEVFIRQGIEAITSNWECNVLIAKSREEAFSLLLEKDLIPDLIISDYRLPGETNGIELINQLREEFNRDIPGIIISGDHSTDLVVQAKQHQVELMHKPLDDSELKRKIADCINVKKLTY